MANQERGIRAHRKERQGVNSSSPDDVKAANTKGTEGLLLQRLRKRERKHRILPRTLAISAPEVVSRGAKETIVGVGGRASRGRGGEGQEGWWMGEGWNG